MWSRRRRRGQESQKAIAHRATLTPTGAAIAACLNGGDTTIAWNAVWDLAQTTDVEAKQEILAMLQEFVRQAVASPDLKPRTERSYHSESVQVRADADERWKLIEQAVDFETAIEESLRRRRVRTLPSAELRKQQQADRQQARGEKLSKMGVRQGEGLPMWMMYMTRRSKRSWDT